MRSQPSPSPKVLFGPFEFEQLSGDLRKFGNRIRLQGKPLRILSILLDQPGEIVSRDELQQQLWQGTTFVDFEQGLNTAVNKLRQALGDSAGQPRYIETVPGKGYRFIAPLAGASPIAIRATVLEMPPAPASAPASPTRSSMPREIGAPDPRQRPSRWGARLLVVVATVAALLAAGLLWFASNRRQTISIPKPARFAVVPPAGFMLEAAASRQSFALSPDGTHLAFTAMDASGLFSAFVRDLNSLEPRLLPGSAGVHTLFWSPDSRSLVLTVGGKVLRAPLDSDARVILGDSPGFVLSGAWLSAHRLLLGAAQSTYSISPSGGPIEPLKDLYRWPQTLPDGEHILYLYSDSKTSRHRGRVVRFGDQASAKDLIESDSRILYAPSLINPGTGYLMYIRAGNLLAQPFDPRALRITGDAMPVVNKVSFFWPTGAADFSVSSTGAIAYQSFASRSSLVWTDRKGRQVGLAGVPNVNLKSGRISPDGRKIVTSIYDIDRGAQNLWIIDSESNAMRQLTLEPGVRDAPVWSPDSRTLAFLHGSVGRPTQVRIRGVLGESDPEEALNPTDFQLPTDWSPDGRFIVFANTGISRLANEIQSDVFLFDLAQNRKLIPVLSTRFHESNAAFSPDGKWLTFTSNESGRPEIYVQAFEATAGTPRVVGERHLVTRSGAQALRWRRDGKELFYLALDGRVFAVPVKLTSKPEFGVATPLFTISTEARAAIHVTPGFDVSPDGQRFLIPVVSSQAGPSIVVMQNWEAALPRQ
jgi:Tol biopolymer transport system component/DNA-binding winged helix-turn-helix (wHTH) protein